MKHSRSRSSLSSHRGSSNSGCMSSAFTFDGLGAGDFQLDSLGVDQSEMSELLDTLQSQDGAALMADLSEMSFDCVDSLNSSGGCAGLTAEAMRLTADAVNHDALSHLDSGNCQQQQQQQQPGAALNGE